MTHSWFRGLLAAVALTTAIGCGDKAGGSGSASAKAESTSKGATSGSAAAAASGSQSAKPEGSAAVAKADAVDVKDILKGDGSGKSSNVLKVDLSKIDETAPALGGTPPKPPEPKAGEQVEWLPVGSFSIMNPGWKKEHQDPLYALISPDEKAAVLFTGFDTPENGGKMVDAIVAQLGFTDATWQDAQPVKVGEDKSIPALLGLGNAKDKDGKPVKLFFMLVKADAPPNLLAIGGADADAPEDLMNTAVGIVALVKRNNPPK
ncbi:MAG: hypothetical protein IPG04_02640 [Polyangiaceae bacterium]|nr:hypothetical protein [Polyangiaceae bacterium]